MTTLRALTSADVAEYRRVRLESLRLEPQNFGSSAEIEAAFDDATWLIRVQPPGGVVLGVWDRDTLLAMCTVIVSYVNNTDAMLVGMWTGPGARRRGFGRQLVEAAIGFARAHHFPRLVLGVVEENIGAIALYKECGFAMTGESTVHSPGVLRTLEMAHNLED